MLADLSPRPGDLDPIETASRDELAAVQRTRLAATLQHAYANVPHYRQAFDAAGAHPDDFRDLPDLARFPFTTKADLRANYPFGMFAVPRDRIARTGLLAGGTVTVSGSMAATVFSHFDTVRVDVAATFATAGAVTVAAGQSVISAGSLTLGDKKDKVANAGLIDTLGGTVTVLGAVTGAGAASVNGGLLDFAASFNQNVTFTGASGELELAKSQSYTATIAGFSKSGGTSLDLGDIGFVGAGEATFKGSKTGGVLTVTDGTHTAHINLTGDYTGSTFVAASDGHGGTLVVDSKSKSAAPPPPPAFVAAMAAIGCGGARLEVGDAGRFGASPMLLAPRAQLA